MKKLLPVAIVVVLLAASIAISHSARAYAQQTVIPAWIKRTAQWWSENQTGDSDFLNAIQYLINQNILRTAPSGNAVYQHGANSTGQNSSQMAQELDDLQARYQTLQSKYNTLLQEVKSITSESSAASENNDSIYAVAVRPVIQSDGFFETTTYQGSVLKISVEIRDGSGLVLVNTAIPTGVDFQSSARTAVQVAQNVTGMDLSKKDVIFSISSNNNEDLQAVDGGSAGGAMTVLLVSDLLGKPINQHVLMTGTIQPDGTIGQIGAAPEKADAAGRFGAKVFLVPQGQAIISVQNCTQKTEGPITYQTCTMEQKPLSPLMENKYGMKVVEIGNIRDALGYFNSP
ncbi:MAG: hypothetical protein KGI33_01675 [Thaumarchaeota archaeon]|nr:hypothetical protein [Nitrososphaerota archaeon]